MFFLIFQLLGHPTRDSDECFSNRNALDLVRLRTATSAYQPTRKSQAKKFITVPRDECFNYWGLRAACAEWFTSWEMWTIILLNVFALGASEP